ncbi:MAG: chemotaxis protein CheB [Bdellovibrionota bacterium]
MKNFKGVFIGASAGGVTAIQELLAAIPGDFDWPIVVVQHLPAKSRIDMKQVYPSGNNRTIVEVEDKILLEPRHVYFATPDYHLLIEPDLSVCLSQDEHVNFSRPSIDIFFSSIAHSLKENAVGILLTGANSDGAAGLKEMHECGALTIVQDPNDAEFSEMPGAAVAMFKPTQILPLDGIKKFLAVMAERKSNRRTVGAKFEN